MSLQDATKSFGQRLLTAGFAERPGLNDAEGDRESFTDYDAALGALFDRAIRGEQVVDIELSKKRSKSDRVELRIDAGPRQALAEILAPEVQQGKGVWYLPESDKQLIGLGQYGHWSKVEPRFANSAADAERASTSLDSVDAIVLWAALIPVFEALYLPIKLRSGHWLGDRRPELMAKDWAKVDQTYRLLGLDRQPLATFHDGKGWAELDINGVINARAALIDTWRNAPADFGHRAVYFSIDRVLERYYSKAKDGKAQRAKVLNKGLERALTAGFGGDWLSFIEYLGEQVHPAEKISTSVEPTSIVAGGSKDQRDAAAAATGVSADQIEKILSSFWGGAASSPVEQRVEVMRDWWREFDRIHAEQAPGKPSLWGLIGDRHADTMPTFDDGRYDVQASQRLPEDLNERIAELWATMVLPRYPGVLVSEPFPNAGFAESFGRSGLALAWDHLDLLVHLRGPVQSD